MPNVRVDHNDALCVKKRITKRVYSIKIRKIFFSKLYSKRNVPRAIQDDPRRHTLARPTRVDSDNETLEIIFCRKYFK